ncbi:MAG TPA: XRE family transcriptional regulator, partial [Thermoanaerobaculia bacterium]|nr:XRE family transcriptional regulator [Thermoanaerobaculia bacterium]
LFLRSISFKISCLATTILTRRLRKSNPDCAVSTFFYFNLATPGQELGRRVGTYASTISRVELGTLEPSAALLTKLCDELDFTPAFFARPVMDEYVLGNCTFRRPNTTPRRLLDQAMARGTAFQEAVAALAMLVVLPPYSLPSIPVNSASEIEAAADGTRELFGLSLRAPIVSMIQLAEHAGVVVTRISGAFERVDAFSHFGAPSVIVLPTTKNNTSTERAKVAHEIGHLVLHRGRPTGDAVSERAADRFARALAMPAQVFGDEFGILPRVDWPHLFELKRRWKAAASDILDRALELDLVPATTARRLYKQYSWRRWHQGEPYEMAPEPTELLAQAIEFAKRDTGETLATLADTLGWGATVAEELTGIAMPEWDVFGGGNVARIDDYRRA